MKVLVTGASGLIGSAVVPALQGRGDEVVRLSRGGGGPADRRWDPERGEIELKGVEGIDAAIHLAGESIAEGRWTPEKKKRIRESRVKGTGLLSEALARLDPRPGTLLAASAVGFYGNRGDVLLDESSAPGTGFLAETCVEWERATQAAEAAGIRVVYMRFGLVLSPEGGLLAKMLTPFRLGVGGPLGSGRQYMSWVAIDDVAGAVQHLLDSRDLKGPVNVVAPNPVTNREFTEALARVLNRPAVMAAPAAALRLMFGEMADEAMLAGQRVLPKVLSGSGYTFRHPELAGALRALLSR